MEALIQTSYRYMVVKSEDLWYIIATDLGKKFTIKLDNSDEKYKSGQCISRNVVTELFKSGKLS